MFVLLARSSWLAHISVGFLVPADSTAVASLGRLETRSIYLHG